MSSTKEETLSFRATRELRTLLEEAAKQERRSLSNMVEVMVLDYCSRAGLTSSLGPMRTGARQKQ